MVNKGQKRRMIEYVAGCLDRSGESINLGAKKIEGKDVNYIKVGDDGIVLMVDQAFGKPRFNRIHSGAQRQFPRVGVLFYKDGDTFFRSAAEKNQFKKKEELSLKHYDNNQMHRMMLLRPEEIRIKNHRIPLQYYQPESQRLEEGIVQYSFGPVRFDYVHVDSSERFKPDNRDSARLFIWNADKKVELSNDLVLGRNLLVNRGGEKNE